MMGKWFRSKTGYVFFARREAGRWRVYHPVMDFGSYSLIRGGTFRTIEATLIREGSSHVNEYLKASGKKKKNKNEDATRLLPLIFDCF